jgi:hypothetical protein
MPSNRPHIIERVCLRGMCLASRCLAMGLYVTIYMHVLYTTDAVNMPLYIYTHTHTHTHIVRGLYKKKFR